jgi:DNA (cytosine-5)-methyltransferase 1
LFWEMLRIVQEVRPRWCLFENVPALRTRGADDVLVAMEEAGYTCWPFVVGAWAVGAPHRRDRVWIVANSSNGRFASEVCDIHEGESDATRCGELADSDPSRLRAERIVEAGSNTYIAGEAVANASQFREREQPAQSNPITIARRAWNESRHDGQLDDSISARLEVGQEQSTRKECQAVERSSYACRWPARLGERQQDWEAPRLLELPLGGSIDGIPARLVRFANRNGLKAYGNSVVPQVVCEIARAIKGCLT